MVSKYQAGDYSADYAYRYGSRLYSVTSTFPGEGTVTYGYGGDGLRRWREVSGGDHTWYNWAMGYSVINEEAEGQGVGNGTLERTYIPGLAEVAGSNPATGDYVYYFQDHIGSTRRLLDGDKKTDATYEFTPYGEVYAHTGDDTTSHLFTGHDWDSTAALYFAPYRYYSPTAARWLTRDPLGMVDGPNVYAYVGDGPVNSNDPTGGFGTNPSTNLDIQRECECMAAAGDAKDYWTQKYGCRKKPKRGQTYIPDTPYKNFMRHCGASCEVAAKQGKTCSFKVGLLNEVYELFDDFFPDMSANSEGRGCANLARGHANPRRQCERCCNAKWGMKN